MGRFRHILSIPMFLTAAALAWVLSRQAGTSGLAIGVVAALILAATLYWLGRRQRGHSSTILPLFAGLAAASLAVVAVARVPAPALAVISGELGGQRFSPAGLEALRASGKPVFVYFTADWCLTCKVNERGALSDARVGKAFADAGISVLIGDWTNGDAEISRFIESRGRAGVPLYLFYGRDGKITELPQILTASSLVALAG
jgi:thiol:disulfide interchange protein